MARCALMRIALMPKKQYKAHLKAAREYMTDDKIEHIKRLRIRDRQRIASQRRRTRALWVQQADERFRATIAALRANQTAFVYYHARLTSWTDTDPLAALMPPPF